MKYVFIQSEIAGKDNCISDLWTVGFFDNNNEWHPESDYTTKEDAIKRVAFLNGDCSKKIEELQDQIDELNSRLENVMINAGVSDF